MTSTNESTRRRIAGIGTRTIMAALAASALIAIAYVVGSAPKPADVLTSESGSGVLESVEERAEAAPQARLDLPSDNGLSELAAVLPGRDQPIKKIKVQGRDGLEKSAELAGDGKIPSAFPSDVPVYPNSVSTGGLAVGGEGAAVALVTQSSVEEVYSFYTRELSDGGWSLDKELLASGWQEKITAKKDERTLWVTITDSPAGAQIFLAVEQRSS